MKLNVQYHLKTKSGKQLTIDHLEALELLEQLQEKLGKQETIPETIREYYPVWPYYPPIQIEPRPVNPWWTYPIITCRDETITICNDQTT